MSDAADRLARTRLAIIEQIQHGEHRHKRSETQRRREREQEGREAAQGESGDGQDGQGWLARAREAVANWWRYHPAHLGLELATPALSAYAGSKPLQFLGIAAAVGAAVVIARPWRLISLTGLLVAIAKSSPVSGVLLSALRHTLEIFAFVLLFNLALGLLFAWAGQGTIAAFLGGLGPLQPAAAAVLGMVPNCAASVLLAQLYLRGAISFGSLFAGLAAGAGIGLAVLWRVNPSRKQNLFLTGLLWAAGAACGILLQVLVPA